MNVRRGERRPRALSVIIPATFTTNHLPGLIAQCRNLRPLEILLVVSPRLLPSLPRAARSPLCRVIEGDREQPPFSGQTAGAMQAKGEILLFLGEDRYYSASGLQRFLFPVLYENVQAVLPREAPRVVDAVKRRARPVQVFARLLNEVCRRRELGAASLLDTPFALTRQAVHKIGIDELTHPGRAFLKLVKSGMQIRAEHVQPVSDSRPFQPQLASASVSQLSDWDRIVISEQLSAIASLPSRGGLSDGGRRRDIAGGRDESGGLAPWKCTEGRPLRPSSLYEGQRLSVIIPACNEERTIGSVIEETLLLEPAEIIVVANGSRDRTAQIARESGATTIELTSPLGVDTGRALGASLAHGDILLFVDADFVIPAMDLFPFVLACQRGTDVALNDPSVNLQAQRADDVVSAAGLALNLAADRQDLGSASILAVPFAMRRESFAPLGWPLLACPPKAQSVAVLAGLSLQVAHQVDSFAMNRFRPQKHLAQSGLSPAVEQILGDHIEALQWLAEQINAKQNGKESSENK